MDRNSQSRAETGALRLTSYSWPELKFTSTSGRTGAYDVERHELKLDQESADGELTVVWASLRD